MLSSCVHKVYGSVALATVLKRLFVDREGASDLPDEHVHIHSFANLLVNVITGFPGKTYSTIYVISKLRFKGV